LLPIALNRVILGGLEIEELRLIKVTSVSKMSERLSTAPAAIDVITQEAIARSGVTTIPEALRLAPGLQVARMDAHIWAISARGFNDVFANKLLVLLDGRSLYTPLFSGVFWDQQDVFLEDVDRIEVIRGPGASLWGANAVNGVINIMTKSAKETQGGLVTGGGGTEELGFGGVRYGGKINENVFYRIYGKYFDRDDSVLPNGQRAQDNWHAGQGGVRFDWDLTDQNLLTLQGDIYTGRYSQVFTDAVPIPPTFTRTYQNFVDVAGANFVSRFSRTLSEDSDLTVQAYYDGMERRSYILGERRHTFDVDGQHRFAWGGRQEIVWGLGYRVSQDDLRGSPTIRPDPAGRTIQLFGGFVQDKISLIENRLDLTLGTKLEHNDFTGFEVQPSGRLSWKLSEQHSVWASVARAVRTPSQANEDFVGTQREFLAPNPFVPGRFVRGFVTLSGNRAFESEELTAYELGYRASPHERWALDLTAFYNVYDHLRTIEPRPPPPPPPVVIPFSVDNLMFGETYGAEAEVHWQAARWWRWSASYSYLQMQLHLDDRSRDTVSQAAEGESPHHQFALRSSMDLPRQVQLDGTVRYVDSLPRQRTPSYLVADVRLAWKARKNLEFAIVGQNLLDRQHPEFATSVINTQPTEVEQSVYGKLTWRF
jgi:iron complex outermembrane receptor protein